MTCHKAAGRIPAYGCHRPFGPSKARLNEPAIRRNASRAKRNRLRSGSRGAWREAPDALARAAVGMTAETRTRGRGSQLIIMMIIIIMIIVTITLRITLLLLLIIIIIIIVIVVIIVIIVIIVILLMRS